MKKFLMLLLLAATGWSYAANGESYESSDLPGNVSPGDLCRELEDRAKQRFAATPDEEVTSWGKCKCDFRNRSRVSEGMYCRLDFTFGKTPKSEQSSSSLASKPAVKLSSGPNLTAARRAAIDYRDRLILGIRSGATPNAKITQDDVANARAEWQLAKREFPKSDHTKNMEKNFNYLVEIKKEQDKAEKSNNKAEPNLTAARREAVDYRGRLILGIRSGATPDAKVTQDDISKARAEWQQAKREFPTSDHAKNMGNDFNYLVEIKKEQDKARGSNSVESDPTLTRYYREPKSSADASGPGKPAARSVSSQPGSTSSSSSPSGSAPREILCFVGTVPPPGYRCSANKKRSDAPANSISR